MSAVGLRERKKVQTRHELALAARRLVVEVGYDALTVADIAAAAEVSTRTFFNYFPSKEAAIVGVDPTALQELADSVTSRPAHETPVVALVHALLEIASADVAEGWVQRIELVSRHAALLPTHLAAMSAVEDALTAAVAQRAGTSTDGDVRPAAMVAAAVGVLRTTLAWWARSDRSIPLEAAMTDAFTFLTSGLSLR
jgi:AcrR family transcriptional regulator